uniref:hypothetical protein n=1 Tax=Ningiella ruwaisensis TaxID=2364274 RepID=UPI0010A05D3F|nr:hypothetical protein [Ningiella ruwaisensis]
MKLIKGIYLAFGLGVIATIGFASDAQDRKLKANLSLKENQNIQLKAEQLGVDIGLYRKLGVIARGYDNLSVFENTTDIRNHPASLQINQLQASFQDIPLVLRDEYSSLLRANYAEIASQLGLDEKQFYTLLINYIILNGEPIEQTDPESLNGPSLSQPDLLNMNDDDEDEPQDEEVVEVITVTANDLNALRSGGHAGMFNRLHRNAYNRWGGSGRGTTLAVFSGGSFTIFRYYHYDSNWTTTGWSTCIGMCAPASIDG